eukprot:gnl/MRDRNA2_/MRDRNA2_110815_c0_seq1.p1 gnl/MRDRNA2_/MRDRNA2_110815_c0~~gnl/MRDRNA2_/MRDRNA2_110815_c0_seq1.p1  ORF type:complete len:227 (+),score=49.27 gnl/MRDRNA2_/MRDRNA2_110815_c0_seq1:90-770(+)
MPSLDVSLDDLIKDTGKGKGKGKITKSAGANGSAASKTQQEEDKKKKLEVTLDEMIQGERITKKAKTMSTGNSNSKGAAKGKGSGSTWTNEQGQSSWSKGKGSGKFYMIKLPEHLGYGIPSHWTASQKKKVLSGWPELPKGKKAQTDGPGKGNSKGSSAENHANGPLPAGLLVVDSSASSHGKNSVDNKSLQVPESQPESFNLSGASTPIPPTPAPTPAATPVPSS